MVKNNSEQNTKRKYNASAGMKNAKFINIFRLILSRRNIIFILLFIITIAVGAYLNSTISDQIFLLQNQVDNMRQTNKSVEEDTKKILIQSEFIQQKLSEQHIYNTQADSIMAQLKDDIFVIKNVDRTDWILFEVEILISLATQKLKILHNKQECQRLVESAIKLLKSTDKKITLPVVEKLNKVLLVLNNMKHSSTEDTYFKLNNIQEAIKQLDAVITNIDTSSNINQENTNNTLKDLNFTQKIKQRLVNLWNKLTNLFIVTKRDNNFTALLSEQEIHLAKLIICSNIEQAKIALLAKNQKIFTESMKNSLKNLQLLTRNSNNKLIKEINQLINIKIDETVDDILLPVLDELAQTNAELQLSHKINKKATKKATKLKENNQ